MTRSLRALASGAGFASVLLAAPYVFAEPSNTNAPVVEDDAMPPPGYLRGHREYEGLSLSPHAPGQASALPGGLMPAVGAPLCPVEGAKFDFHGYLQAGGRTGLNKRQNPGDDQSFLVWHGDPVVPRGNVFENTNTVA